MRQKEMSTTILSGEKFALTRGEIAPEADSCEGEGRNEKAEEESLGLVINFDECVDEFCELAKVLTFRPKPQPPAP